MEVETGTLASEEVVTGATVDDDADVDVLSSVELDCSTADELVAIVELDSVDELDSGVELVVCIAEAVEDVSVDVTTEDVITRVGEEEAVVEIVIRESVVGRSVVEEVGLITTRTVVGD